ncbi:MAG: VIT domain-containing protein [Syntrophobacteraceae bacterium]
MKLNIEAFSRRLRLFMVLLTLVLLAGLSIPGSAPPSMEPAADQESGSSIRLGSLAAFLLASTAYGASEKPQDDRTLSPYFFVKSDDPNLDALPLKSTNAEVSISGVIADVKVTQTYRNEGKKTLEAIYVFPASTRAAVYGMRMTIGERTIVAEIQKRDEARRTYEQAKQQGKSASLLEQQRPNVFQMNIANILPGDEIKTELHYTELILPTDGTYEFVYPTVVGPRYSNQPAATAPPSETWVANPYLHQGEKPPYAFDLTAHLSAGMPIQDITCGSHPVDIQFADASRADVRLKKGEAASGNRDFILKFRLAGKQIQSGLLLHEGEKENFFLLTMQPPDRVTPKEIPPREYVFIVDVSGSMHGFPLDVSKNLLRNLMQGLRTKDSFNVLLFSGGSSLLSERSLPATPENVRRAVNLLERQQGGGGTELLPALQRALALPKSEGAARVFVIVTDGYVAVETESFDLLQRKIGEASFFSFGIGSSVNRFLIEGLARAGAGESFVVTKPAEGAAKAEEFRKLIESPVLTQIKLNLGSFDAYDLEPSAIPDLFSEKPIVVTGKWRGRPEGKLTLNGFGGGGPHQQSLDVSTTKPDARHGALQYLWARSRIARIVDYNLVKPNDDRTQQITSLGLQYHLLTAYTSFVAVDSLVRNKGGEQTTITQPLPLPEGVSDHALGGAMGPPPSAAGRAMRMGVGAAPSMAPPPPTGPAMETERSSDSSLETAFKKSLKTEDQGAADKPVKPHLVSLTVEGPIAETAIRSYLERQLPALVRCRDKRFPKGVLQEIGLVIVFDAQGAVKEVQLTGPSKLPPESERCLLKAVKAWKLTIPKASGDTTVTATIKI